MLQDPLIKNRSSRSWELDTLRISHHVIDYHSFGTMHTVNETESVRLHVGLSGSYDFSYAQLDQAYSLSGHHNNIMYSKGLDLRVLNKSERIETFGIDFHPVTFAAIGQNGNDPLKRFTDDVINKKNCILSRDWKCTDFQMQQVIQEIIHCPYSDELKELFLLSKSIELLVLQAELYNKSSSQPFIKSTHDKKKLIEAKELLSERISDPPSIAELAKLIGINEYKLKKGFKELFGTTIFGFIHQSRMGLAKKLLLGTDMSAKEIAYEMGFSSPQHFSHAFKKTYGVPPTYVRSNPDSVRDQTDESANLGL